MKIIPFFSKSLVSALGFSLCLSSGFVQASGSFGGGVAGVDSQKNTQYHRGKSVLRKQLLCDACPLDGSKVNRSTAPEILAKLKSGKFSAVLNGEDEKALSTYLIRRYRIDK